jgi:CRP/FNR family transcriptional regulator, cyclic AMP receptor protein
VTFLDALSPDEAAELRRRATPRSFKRGAALAHVDQIGDRVLVITRGHVKVTRPTDQGRDVMLALRGPGDLVGEQAALDGLPRSASMVALGPVEALALSADDFLAFATSRPDAAGYLLRMLATRLRDADAKRLEHAGQDVLGRLAVRLVELVERCGEPADDGILIDLPLTQEDLASWVGSSREAVARALQQMRDLGWVTTARRAIVVRDLAAVKARAS